MGCGSAALFLRASVVKTFDPQMNAGTTDYFRLTPAQAFLLTPDSSLLAPSLRLRGQSCEPQLDTDDHGLFPGQYRSVIFREEK